MNHVVGSLGAVVSDESAGALRSDAADRVGWWGAMPDAACESNCPSASRGRRSAQSEAVLPCVLGLEEPGIRGAQKGLMCATVLGE